MEIVKPVVWISRSIEINQGVSESVTRGEKICRFPPSSLLLGIFQDWKRRSCCPTCIGILHEYGHRGSWGFGRHQSWCRWFWQYWRKQNLRVSPNVMRADPRKEKITLLWGEDEDRIRRDQILRKGQTLYVHGRIRGRVQEEIFHRLECHS